MGNSQDGQTANHPRFKNCTVTTQRPPRMQVTIPNVQSSVCREWESVVSQAQRLKFKGVLVPLSKESSDHDFCGDRKCVKVVLPHLPNLVEELVNQRIKLSRPFSEQELNLFMKQMAKVVEELTVLDFTPSVIHPHNLLYSDSGDFSLVSAFSLPPTAEDLEWAAAHSYPSPEQLDAVRQRRFFQKIDQKSYIFSTGMTSLHLAGLSSCDDVYERRENDILWEELIRKIERVGSLYSAQFKDLLKWTLNPNPEARPTSYELSRALS